MHDTVASRVTDNCPLGPSRGRADGNLWRDGLISHLTRRITGSGQIRYLSQVIYLLIYNVSCLQFVWQSLAEVVLCVHSYA